MATQLLKLRPYKTTVMHALQLHGPASVVHFCSWFLQSVVEAEISLQLTFFSGFFLDIFFDPQDGGAMFL
jgi:hypothetical protein